MPATHPTSMLPVQALRKASTKAEMALRTAADQVDIVKRAATQSQRWDRRMSQSVLDELRDMLRHVLNAHNEIFQRMSAAVEAIEAVAEPAPLESTEPTAPARRVAQRPAARRSHTVDASPARDDVSASFEALLREGALLDSARFQERAGFSRQALSKAVGAKRLFYVEVGAIRGYPAFYLDPQLQRKQVETVCKLLGDLSGGSKWLFFTTPKGSLARQATGQARTPLEALADGDLAKVKLAASGYAQR